MPYCCMQHAWNVWFRKERERERKCIGRVLSMAIVLSGVHHKWLYIDSTFCYFTFKVIWLGVTTAQFSVLFSFLFLLGQCIVYIVNTKWSAHAEWIHNNRLFDCKVILHVNRSLLLRESENGGGREGEGGYFSVKILRKHSASFPILNGLLINSLIFFFFYFCSGKWNRKLIWKYGSTTQSSTVTVE